MNGVDQGRADHGRVDHGRLDQGRLRRLASETSVLDAGLGREIGAASDRCFARIRVQISGRSGVGKSSVRTALERHGAFDDDVDVTETAALDVPRSPDPILDGDVVVHVLANGAQATDVDVLASAPTAVAVLAKADTIDDLSSTLARLTEAVRVPVLPLMGTIAASVSGGEPTTFADLRAAVDALPEDALLTPDRFERAAPDASSRQQRRALVDLVELSGVRIAVAALRANPAVDDVALRRKLADASGIEQVVGAVRRSIDGVRTDRDGRLLHRLTELTAAFPLAAEDVERYLAGDEAVLAVMRSALRAVGEVHDHCSPLDAARLWHRRADETDDPDYCRAAVAISRGYLRMRTP